MKTTQLLIVATAFMMASCMKPTKENTVSNQSNFPEPPVAEVIPDTFVNFGKNRVDNYFWIKDKNNPKLMDYLTAENAYTDTVMAATSGLQEKIYNEILGRVKEDDESYPTLRNGYYYYTRTEKGKQYATYCRKKGTLDAEEVVFFDVNKMAEGKSAYVFGGYSVSPDNSKAAYLYNETGSFADYVLKIKDLTTGEVLDFSVSGASSFAWANDNKTLFYSVIDPVTLRSYRVYRHTLGSAGKTLVYEERDVKFSTGVSGSKTREWIVISSSSSTTSEEWLIDANNPTESPKTFCPREQDVDYGIYPHKEFFFIRYKDKANLNGKIYQVAKADYANRAAWKEIVAHDSRVRIESLSVLKDYLIIETRKNGLNNLEIRNLRGGKSRFVSFPEPVYSVSSGGNPEYDATTFRYSYTSLNRPRSLYQ